MYEGFIDALNQNSVSGWVFNNNDVNEIVDLEIYDKNILISVLKADVFRSDLLQAKKGNGVHGFFFSFKGLSVSNISNIRIKVKKTKEELFISSSNLIIDLKSLLINQFIKGQGIEIGALHNPLAIPNSVKVKYVDRMNKEDLFKHYPDLKNLGIVDVDIIDDGEILSKIEDSSQDFIIANHMLEHCKNPIQTIKNFFQRLKSKGILYLTIPDKRFTFDKERNITEFDHLLKDFLNENDHFLHFIEWSKFCNNIKDEKKILEDAKRLFEMDYSIHYHVWDMNSFVDFLLKTSNYFKYIFDIINITFNETEVIAILQKK